MASNTAFIAAHFIICFTWTLSQQNRSRSPVFEVYIVCIISHKIRISNLIVPSLRRERFHMDNADDYRQNAEKHQNRSPKQIQKQLRMHLEKIHDMTMAIPSLNCDKAYHVHFSLHFDFIFVSTILLKVCVSVCLAQATLCLLRATLFLSHSAGLK